MYPRKYDRSTYKGNRILCVDVYQDEDGSRIVIKTIKDSLTAYMLPLSVGFSNSMFDYSADAFLCQIQDHRDINVSKY